MRRLILSTVLLLGFACGSAESGEEDNPNGEGTEPDAPATVPNPEPSPAPEPQAVGPGQPEPSTPSGGATRGALSVEILPGCDAEAAILNFPPTPSPPVSATSRGEALENGGMAPDGTPALATCNFTQVEPPYSISCRLEYGTVDEPHVAVFRATGGPGTTADGSLALAGMQIGGQYSFTQYGSTFDSPCQYQLLEADPVAGMVWGQITCSSLVDTSGQDSCGIGTSYFYFENCE
jgi:hypothetical protein